MSILCEMRTKKATFMHSCCAIFSFFSGSHTRRRGREAENSHDTKLNLEFCFILTVQDMTFDETIAQKSETERLRAEAKALRLENNSLRSAMDIMSAKMIKYHEKATRLQQAYQKAACEVTKAHQQARKMDRLEKVLKLSHKSFLKMERKNKALLAINQSLQLQRRKQDEDGTLISDSSNISIEEDTSTHAFSLPSCSPLRYSGPNGSPGCDDVNREVIFTNIPPFSFQIPRSTSPSRFDSAFPLPLECHSSIGDLSSIYGSM